MKKFLIHIFIIICFIFTFTGCVATDDTPSGLIKLIKKTFDENNSLSQAAIIIQRNYKASDADPTVGYFFPEFMTLPQGKIRSITEEINETGDEAIVTVKGSTGTFKCKLKKENSKWKVFTTSKLSKI